MNEPSKPFADEWKEAQARAYLTLGFVAAFAISLSLMQYSDDIWVVIPTLLVLAGLTLNWLSAPVFVLLSIALTLLALPHRFAGSAPLTDAMLAGSVVAAIVAHFRLYSIKRSIFPIDTRRALAQKRPKTATTPLWLEILMLVTIVPYIIYLRHQRFGAVLEPRQAERRSSPLTADEWLRAIGIAAFAAAASVGLWSAAMAIRAPLLIVRQQWQVGLMVWFVLAPVTLCTIVISYRAARRRPFTEARLILADELWRETRRDQRRIARRIQHARLQAKSKHWEMIP